MAYPHPLSHDLFPVIPPYVPPKPQRLALRANVAPSMRGVLRVPRASVGTAGKLWVRVKGSNADHSQTFQSVSLRANADLKPEAFYFVPGVEDMEVYWEVQNCRQIKKVEWQLWSHFDQNAPVWTKSYTDGAAQMVLDQQNGAGKFAFSEIDIMNDDDRFPGGVPNVAYAPYQLRIKIEDRGTGKISHAWTYFDVLVDHLELHWGAEKYIPNEKIPGTHDLFAAKTQTDEKALLKRLKGDPEVTLIDPKKDVELRLRSTNAGYIDFPEWYAHMDFAFLRHKARWGDGPRLPLFAKVFLKKHDDTSVHSKAAGKALGPAPFLWDFTDRPSRDRAKRARTMDEGHATFVRAAQAYKWGDPAGHTRSDNCHADKGGKRGDKDRPIFLLRNDPRKFPFKVDRSGLKDRVWCSISRGLSTGDLACWTGVMFNPSRMALDSYNVTATLAKAELPETLKPLDKMNPIYSLSEKFADLPYASTGLMEVIRQIDARYVRKSAQTPKIDLKFIDKVYWVAGIHIEWTEELWTKVQHDQLLAAALQGNAFHENDGRVRNVRRASAAQQRKKVIAGCRDGLGGTCIQDYDHWWGTKTGAKAPAHPSNAEFTFPARDLALADYIAAEVKKYVERNRFINTPKKKWNADVAAYPSVSARDLRVKYFFRRLSQKTRNALWPAIESAAKGAGWKGVSEEHPVKFSRANYIPRGWILLADEIHQRKILTDAFDGMTFFHYESLYELIDIDGNVVSHQIDVGGKAAVAMSVDLGLKSAFCVWDHPSDGRREKLIAEVEGKQVDYMNGNAGAAHEFGHFMHLPHAKPTGGEKEAFMHDQQSEQCIMNYDKDGLHLCGGCSIRVRGWSFFRDPDAGLDGTNNYTPDTCGAEPQLGDKQKEAIDAFYNGFF